MTTLLISHHIVSHLNISQSNNTTFFINRLATLLISHFISSHLHLCQTSNNTHPLTLSTGDDFAYITSYRIAPQHKSIKLQHSLLTHSSLTHSPTHPLTYPLTHLTNHTEYPYPTFVYQTTIHTSSIVYPHRLYHTSSTPSLISL